MSVPLEEPTAPLPRRRFWTLPLRREERLIALVLVVGVLLCIASGTGFTPRRIFVRYLNFFVAYLGPFYVLSRLLVLARVRWRPVGALGLRFQRWLGGPREELGGALLRTD